MTKRKARCSPHPQGINQDVWYYENPGNIEVFIDSREVSQLAAKGVGIRFTIPKYRLERSLQRMRGPVAGRRE